MCKCEEKDITCDNCEKLYNCTNRNCFNSSGFVNHFSYCNSCYITYKKCLTCEKAKRAEPIKCVNCMRWHGCDTCDGWLHNLPECKYPRPIIERYLIDKKNSTLVSKYIQKSYGVPGYVISIKILKVDSAESKEQNIDKYHVRYSYTVGCSCCGQCVETFNFIGKLEDIADIFSHYYKGERFRYNISSNNKDGYTYLENYELMNQLITSNKKPNNNVEVYFYS